MIRIGLTSEHEVTYEILQNPGSGTQYSYTKPLANFLLSNNLKYFKNNDHDVLETHLFPIITKNKWIYNPADAPSMATFNIFGQYLSRTTRLKLIKKLFLKNNFKKLIFKSYTGFKSLKTYTNWTDKRILNKTCVVYPAIRKINNKIKFNKKKINMLFVGRDFILKGGQQLISSFQKLEKKFDNLKLTIISDFCNRDSQFDPYNIKWNLKKRITDNKNTIFKFKVRREVLLKKYYPNSDIFIMPTLKDSFGFSLLEAQAFGLPIISTNCFAIPEIIEDNKSGLLIGIKDNKFYKDPNKFKNKNDKYIIPKSLNKKLTNGIYIKLKELIENPSLRKKLSRNALKTARTKFSFKKRNKIMRKIYEESIH